MERKHRHIVKTGLALLSHSHVPHEYWDYAFQIACYLINRILTPMLKNMSPYQLMFRVSPDYKFLHIFGCACWSNLRPYNSKKLQPRSVQCIFLGYSLRHKGYQCLNPISGRLYISRDVVFEEKIFPFSVPNNSCTSDTSQAYPSSTPTLTHIPTSLFFPNAPQSTHHTPSLSPHMNLPPATTLPYPTHPTQFLSPHMPLSPTTTQPYPPATKVHPLHDTSSSHLISHSNTPNLPHLSLIQNATSFPLVPMKPHGFTPFLMKPHYFNLFPMKLHGFSSFPMKPHKFNPFPMKPPNLYPVLMKQPSHLLFTIQPNLLQIFTIQPNLLLIFTP